VVVAVGQSPCPAVPGSCRARVRTSSFTFARGFSSCPVFAASHAPKKLPRRRACASSLTVHGEIDDMRPVMGHRLDGAFTMRAWKAGWPWSSRRRCQKYMVWLNPVTKKGREQDCNVAASSTVIVACHPWNSCKASAVNLRVHVQVALHLGVSLHHSHSHRHSAAICFLCF